MKIKKGVMFFNLILYSSLDVMAQYDKVYEAPSRFTFTTILSLIILIIILIILIKFAIKSKIKKNK